MTIYQVKIRNSAIKYLEKINEPHYSLIKRAIRNLAKNPRPMGYKKLKGREAYRIRVANYRIIYEIFDEILLYKVH